MIFRRLLMVGICAVLLCACTQQDQDKDEPKKTEDPAALQILEPADEATIEGNVVELKLEVDGLEIVKADGDTSGKTGHFHVFIDRDAVAVGETIPKEAGIIHSTSNPIKVTGLSKGSHELTVVVGDGTHKRIGLAGDEDASASVNVEVEGPSVDASAPTELTLGQDLTIEVKVDGVSILAADKDEGAAGTTGHLHAFIDPAEDPAADGKPIPKDATHIHTTETSIKVAAALLTAGEHTIWIVLGDKSHIPYGPLVADKVTFTVK